MTKRTRETPTRRCKQVTGVKANKRGAAKQLPVPPVKKRKPIVNRKPHTNYKFIDLETRVDVIYDNFTHNLQPLEISKQREMKYNTVRSLLENYYQYGRINVKKKQSGCRKQPPPSKLNTARSSSTRTSDRRCSFESSGGVAPVAETRHYRR